MKTFSRTIKMLLLGMSSLAMITAIQAEETTFTASIKILTALSITKVTDLSFPDTTASITSQDIVIAPEDSGAATFTISGDDLATVQASIVESSVTMTNGTTGIVIDSFTFGGDLSTTGQATLGTGTTSANVGATANIPGNPNSGTYSGSITFRVVYN